MQTMNDNVHAVLEAADALEAAIGKLEAAAVLEGATSDVARAHVLARRHLAHEPRPLAHWLDVPRGTFASRLVTLRKVVAACFGSDMASHLDAAEFASFATPTSVARDVTMMLDGTFVAALAENRREKSETAKRQRDAYDREREDRAREAEEARREKTKAAHAADEHARDASRRADMVAETNRANGATSLPG